MAKNPTTPKTPAAGETAQNEGAAQTEGATEAPKVRFKRRLTVRDVCGTPDAKKLPEDGSEVKLCRIAGFAENVKSGSGTFADWSGVVGQMAATNYETGEIFTGSVAIIPGNDGAAIVAATENALREDAGSKTRFAVDVYVKRVIKGTPEKPEIKFEYVVKPVLEIKVTSPALDLLAL